MGYCMDFKVIWSDETIADLEGIYSYIARDDPDAAMRIVRGILAHVHILGSFPFIGPSYLRGASGTLREIAFVLTGSSTMSVSGPRVSRFFMFGIEPEKSRRSEGLRWRRVRAVRTRRLLRRCVCLGWL